MINSKTETRISDEKKEPITTELVINYIVKILSKNDTFEIVKDKERQVKGIDVILNYKDKIYTIDLKAATDYVNKEKPLNSFAQEITTLNQKGKVMTGWLLNENLLNEYIGYIWIDNAKNANLSSVSDIERAEIAVVKKDKIINYLDSVGMIKELLLSIADDLRFNDGKNIETITNGKYKAYNGKNGRIYVGDMNKDKFGIVYSKTNKKEQPINVKIPRKELVKMADIHNKLAYDYIY